MNLVNNATVREWVTSFFQLANRPWVFFLEAGAEQLSATAAYPLFLKMSAAAQSAIRKIYFAWWRPQINFWFDLDSRNFLFLWRRLKTVFCGAMHLSAILHENEIGWKVEIFDRKTKFSDEFAISCMNRMKTIVN